MRSNKEAKSREKCLRNIAPDFPDHRVTIVENIHRTKIPG